MEIWYVLQMFWKDGLTKKVALKYDLFCIIWKDGIFFTRKYDTFSLDGKWKMIFLKKINWNTIFSGCMYKCYKYDITLLPKKSKTIFSRENTLKDDCILGWHSRKSSNDSLYFYGDLHRRFHILLSSEKNPENLIYRVEIWLLLQFIWFMIFYNKESSILCSIQPSGVVFRGVLERQLRKFFVY